MPILRRFARTALGGCLLVAYASGVHATPAGFSLPKLLQIHRLAAESMEARAEHLERADRLREIRALAKRKRREGRTALRSQGHRARRDESERELPRGVPRSVRTAIPPFATTGPPRPNVRCNNPAGDGADAAQSETAIVAWNNNLLAAWNDGQGFNTGSDIQGWATSVDGGLTWTDQGNLPHPSAYPTWRWTSDPVLAVNPATGAIYYAGLADVDGTFGHINGIGVVKGRFSGGTFAWGTPSLVRTLDYNNNDFLDKQWIAVDPATGRVHLTCTAFFGDISQIDYQSADSALSAWTAPFELSTVGERGLVQGSRPIVRPNGDICVAYTQIGDTDLDQLVVRRSTDGGATFPDSGGVGFYSNFGTGAPGFNRNHGVEFAGIAADRSGGAHNGRLHLTWMESLNWYDDSPNAGLGGDKNEVEPNDAPATATPIALGQTVHGIVSSSGSPGDLDYYAITLGQGQTVLVKCDSIATTGSIRLRMLATDGTTFLAFTTASPSDVAFKPGWIFTAPVSGKYYVRVGNNLGGTGAYRLRIGAATRTTERGTDQRNVYSAFSDNGGVTWSTPVRVDTAPVGFDGWLPEVAVAGDGHVYCAWYDWRDATASSCGGESSVYLARSDDGGASWVQLGATSDARTSWSTVQSNLIPNQGDYLSLFANNTGVYTCWGDGRGGNPEVYMSAWMLTETPTLVSLVSASATSDRVDLEWFVADSPGFTATVERREGSGVWAELGTISPDGAGTLRWSDTQVAAGATYEYRLRVGSVPNAAYFGAASVNVPERLAFALAGVRPNPAGRSATIAFTLPSAEPATLSVLDIGGRVVASREVGSLGVGQHVVPFTSGGTLAPGVYLVRLARGERVLTTRVSIVR